MPSTETLARNVVCAHAPVELNQLDMAPPPPLPQLSLPAPGMPPAPPAAPSSISTQYASSTAGSTSASSTKDSSGPKPSPPPPGLIDHRVENLIAQVDMMQTHIEALTQVVAELTTRLDEVQAKVEDLDSAIVVVP